MAREQASSSTTRELRSRWSCCSPDLGPTQIWGSDYTIAPTELEIEGSSFSIRAYSPLFMDVGPSDLEIRLFGLDANRADALLAIEPVGVE